ncbi:MAG TPA: hypothetical protein VFZ66_26490 [Herpetosiphonaceae bacterium]
MITTVTTATTTAVSTVGTASFTLVTICTVMILLLNKEIILVSKRDWAARLNKTLNVAIVPLLIVFITTLMVRVLSVLDS